MKYYPDSVKETQLGQVAPGIELRPYDKESL